jgi:coiled-coil domain-containing protein 78
MRAVTSKSYAYHVETSYVEAHEEAVHDLYAPKSFADGARTEFVAVVEDPLEGWMVQGAKRLSANSAEEAHEHLRAAVRRRWSHDTDIGNVQQHTTSFFTAQVFQYWPAVGGHTEDRVLCSQIRFARSAGAERLAMDPALLRIREGTTLNKSLITFSGALQVCLDSCSGVNPGLAIFAVLRKQARPDSGFDFASQTS